MLRAFIVALSLVLLFQGTAQGEDRADSLLESIQKKHQDLPGLSVTYCREVITRSMTMLGNRIKGDPATGRIYFKPPHFLRLQQETPEQETIITNGEMIWWYIPDKKRAYKYPSRKFGKELKLLSDIFGGLTNVEENFQVVTAGKNELGESQIELFPDPPWQEVERMVITVNGSFDIRGVDIHNHIGSITRFRLGDPVVRKDFREGFFRFSLPEGVLLVEEEG